MTVALLLKFISINIIAVILGHLWFPNFFSPRLFKATLLFHSLAVFEYVDSIIDYFKDIITSNQQNWHLAGLLEHYYGFMDMYSNPEINFYDM